MHSFTALAEDWISLKAIGKEIRDDQLAYCNFFVSYLNSPTIPAAP
jgi:hypothetical protein